MERPLSKISTEISFKTLQKEYLSDSPWVNVFLAELSLKSVWVWGHSVRVGYILSELATDKKLGCIAGILHDIGKLAVPNSVLDGQKLTGQEKELLEVHPRIAYEIIRPYDPEVAQIVVGHHEYQKRPYSRKVERNADDEKINLYRKLLALSDQVDSLLSKRPYKDSWTGDEVVAELRSNFSDSQIEKAIEIYQKLGK